MKKKRICVAESFCAPIKIWRIMRLSLFFVLVCIAQVWATNSYSQQTRLTMNLSNVKVIDVLNEIEEKTEYFFLFNQKLVNVDRVVNVKVNQQKVEEVLSLLFDDYSIDYRIMDRQIVLSPDNLLSKQAQRTITGNVTNESGQPIPGATVVVKGTSHGVITDPDGNFQLTNVETGQTLVISFVGMTTQEVPITAQSSFNIILQESTIGLEEVVAVGYGVQKKVNLTGAITALDGEELARRQVAQTSMVLQGVAPGVAVTQRNGQPGRDGGTISIRGKTTLGNSNPLILVDGIEMGINNIDPTLIESISVLKDAASSSIYGSRAANGVILITTKRGQKDKLSVSYNGYVGWQDPTDLPDVVGAIDHMTLTNEAYVNTGKSPLYTEAYIEEYKQGMQTNPDRYPDTDWYDQVLTENGLMQSHFLTMNGGSEKVRVLASLGYLDQNGLMSNTDFKRYTLRINTDLELTNTFSAQIDAHIKKSKLIEPSRGTASAIHWSGRIPANQTAVLSSGQWGEGWNGDNPVAFTKDGGLRVEDAPSFTLNLVLKYQPVNWLSLDVAYSPNYWQTNYSDFEKSIQTYRWDGSESYKAPQKTTLNASHNRSLHNNLRGTVTFDKTFGNHGIKLLTGYQQEDYRNDALRGYREVFPFPDYPVLNSGGEENQKAYGSASEWALLSFFGRLNYDYKERYLLEANFRQDGSSRFATGRKWGFFPSFSAGWRVSEENFFSGLKPIISNLKMRASWGRLGNQDIGLYPFSSDVNLGLKYAFDKQVASGAGITDLANTEISWETTTASNFGLDLTLFDRLNIVAEYYYKVSEDILLALDIPKIIGMNAPEQNAGEVENRGWDLGINYTNWDNEFKYDIGFNISDVKNKVTDLKGVNKTGLTVYHEGYPMHSIYGLEADGFISEEDFDEEGNYLGATQYGTIAPGDIKYIDQNNDSIINASDYKIIGETIPRFTFGLTFNSQYKNFDLGLFFQGVGKADGLIRGQGIMPFVEGGTVQEQHKDHWTPENRDATFPRLAFNETNNEQVSSFWMKDASYIRLKNLQIGYSFPSRIINRIKAEKLRIYLSGQNLFTIDNFWNGYDVEAPVGNGGYYPQVKTYSIGVDIKF
ncbi:TonB-dependent receptor [Sunxiuqinia elliptica]|uniref:TonB-linked outer membrane protein, SusC/RagA family n=1 Tax=Sunxiuqinia elliptica TaxID=655355 RepID=A0A1I2HFA5_9BACT|nr:TonB-dependent receptor [Sunxiuqinia elliptica]SFF27597.1 TonB-linked outer membrane protein, SusC/RagA family [Sunxiuqinia elliptica]